MSNEEDCSLINLSPSPICLTTQNLIPLLLNQSKKRKFSQNQHQPLIEPEININILKRKPPSHPHSLSFTLDLSPSIPATSVSNTSLATSFEIRKDKKRKVSKLYRKKTTRKERKERKRKRFRIDKINRDSNASTGYCSTALESLYLSDSSLSSSTSGIEADVESLGKKSFSDNEKDNEQELINDNEREDRRKDEKIIGLREYNSSLN